MDYRNYGISAYKPTPRSESLAELKQAEAQMQAQTQTVQPAAELQNPVPAPRPARSFSPSQTSSKHPVQEFLKRLLAQTVQFVRTHRSPKIILAVLGGALFTLWFFLGEFRFMFWRYPSFTGFPFSSRTYLVLFQNNYELRPTGGFISSYAELTFAHGVYTGFTLHDVYDETAAPEKAPLVLSTLLASPTYKGHTFRDANFDPDFRLSKDELIHFYQLSHPDAEIDGVFAADFSFLESWVAQFQPLTIEQADVASGSLVPITLTADNLFKILTTQVSDVDHHSEKALAERKDIQGPLVNALLHKTLIFPWRITAFLDLMAQNFREKHLLATFNLSGLQSSFHYRNWDGALPQSDSGDFLAVNEGNYGGMKSDRYLTRSVRYDLEITSDRDILNNPVIKATTLITLTHNGTYDAPLSGPYSGYLRVLVPHGAKILTGGSVSESREDSTVIGEIVRLNPGESKTFTYSYELPEYVWYNGIYKLHLNKQPGTEADAYQVVVHAPAGMSLNAPQFDVRENVAFYTAPLLTDTDLSFELLPDKDPPRVVSNELTALNEITVEFNEPLQSQSASNPSLYQVQDLDLSTPGTTDAVTVIAARTEGRTLILTTQGMTSQPEEFYQVILRDLADRQGNVQTQNPRILTVVQRGLPEEEATESIESNVSTESTEAASSASSASAAANATGSADASTPSPTETPATSQAPAATAPATEKPATPLTE